MKPATRLKCPTKNSVAASRAVLPRSLREPILPLYQAAMDADDNYRDTIYELTRKSRWSVTQEEHAHPRIQAAFRMKVEADRVWLAALRLAGPP